MCGEDGILRDEDGNIIGIKIAGIDDTIDIEEIFKGETTEGTTGGNTGGTEETPDTTAPTVTISLSSNTTTEGTAITATVTHTDTGSGVNILNCKYIYDTTSGTIGITDSRWDSANIFTSNPQTINLTASSAGTYYLHVLTVDNEGNKSEAVSEAVTVSLITYSITYNLNGGTQGDNAVTSYNIATSTFNLPTPTKSGYTFAGWYTSSDFSGTAETQIATGSTGNKVYYAKWESTSTIPTFTYTGEYEIVDDDDNKITASTGDWKIRFLTSGTLIFTELNGAANGIDVFCVGGGGGGAGAAYYDSYSKNGWGGSGGKSTTTYGKGVNLSTEYIITIGSGGNGTNYATATTTSGGETYAFGTYAAGGSGNAVSNITYEFDKTSGKPYGKAGTRGGYASGAANTGNGGDGAVAVRGGQNGKAGGSGIVIIRNAR